MKATLLDIVTGEKREVTANQHGREISPFEWADNNWSCDCNRQDCFDVEEFDGCRAERFLVVDFELTDEEKENWPDWRSANPRYFNQEYPEETLNIML